MGAGLCPVLHGCPFAKRRVGLFAFVIPRRSRARDPIATTLLTSYHQLIACKIRVLARSIYVSRAWERYSTVTFVFNAEIFRRYNPEAFLQNEVPDMSRKLLGPAVFFLVVIALVVPTVNSQNIPEPNCTRENGEPCYGGSRRPTRTPEETAAIQEARRERAEANRKKREENRAKRAEAKKKKDLENAQKKQAQEEAKAKKKREQEEAKLAAQQAASAKRHGINANSLSGNAVGARDEAGKPFDTAGTRSTADEVDLKIAEYRQTADRPVPAALAKDPKYKKLSERVKKDESKLKDLQKQLDDVRQKRATATGSDKGKLEVSETNVQQEMSNVKSDMAVGIVGMHDMRVSFEEEASAPPRPKPGIVVPPKP